METEQLRLDPARIEPGVAAILEDPAKGFYFVAETRVDGAPAMVGQIMVTFEWSDWRNGNIWWIQSVYVAGPFRRRGVFRALFEQVRSLARSRPDVCALRLYMDAHNTAARRTYERLGMSQTNYEVFDLDFVMPGKGRG
jgi:GNAT superfamily N-acetyltransferase